MAIERNILKAVEDLAVATPGLAEPRIKFTPEERVKLDKNGWIATTIPASISIPLIQDKGEFGIVLDGTSGHDQYRRRAISRWKANVHFDSEDTLQIAWQPKLLDGTYGETYGKVKTGHKLFRRMRYEWLPAMSYEDQKGVVERFSQKAGLNAVIPSVEQLSYLLYFYYWKVQDEGGELPFGAYSRTTTTYTDEKGESFSLGVALGTDWVDSLECTWSRDWKGYWLGVMPLIFPKED